MRIAPTINNNAIVGMILLGALLHGATLHHWLVYYKQQTMFRQQVQTASQLA
jgi:hypothetical protein